MSMGAGNIIRRLTHACLMMMSALLTGCAGAQSVLDPAGPQANRTGKIWWLFFYVCVAVLILVIIFLLVAVYRGRVRREGDGDVPEVEENPERAPDPNRERRMTNTVTVATVVTVVTLIVLTIYSFSTGRSLSSTMSNKDAVTIELTGHQWWWEARYESGEPSKYFITANELHIPVGQPVTIKLRSTDVIHSFWVPNLVGKKDLIPGHDAIIWFQADKPGSYRGQCAEYCGLQHAHMAFWVIAEPLDKFQAWQEQQRQPAPEPDTDTERRGQQVFLNTPCIMCHTIQGTLAAANIGPDLTHLASRSYIAGVLPNTPDNMIRWIENPPQVDHLTAMPNLGVTDPDARDIAGYLYTLK